jgi:hypothetical protein
LIALGFETETTRSDAGSGLEATEDRLHPASGWDPGLVLSEVFSTPLSLFAFASFFLIAAFCSFIKLEKFKNYMIKKISITQQRSALSSHQHYSQNTSSPDVRVWGF